MSNFVWPSIGFYCLCGIFVFYQQLHAKNFKGASELFGLVLSISAFAGTVTGLVHIGYYAWTISWWAAAVILVLGILSGILGLVFERFTGPFALSMLGFVGWPVCAYFMFSVLPSSA